MSNIIIPGEDEKEEKNLEPEYQATEEDEERFFLMYHMSFQPSEVDKLTPLYRRWLVMRYVAQKNMEKEAMERMQLMSRLGPNLGVGGG